MTPALSRRALVPAAAHGQAQNEQLKALIEQARPVIQKHLGHAG